MALREAILRRVYRARDRARRRAAVGAVLDACGLGTAEDDAAVAAVGPALAHRLAAAFPALEQQVPPATFRAIADDLLRRGGQPRVDASEPSPSHTTLIRRHLHDRPDLLPLAHEVLDAAGDQQRRYRHRDRAALRALRRISGQTFR